MNDDEVEIEVLLDIKAIALWLLGVVVTLIAWIGTRNIRRLDDLEKTAATKEEFRIALDEVREERRIHHQENGQKLDRIAEKIDANEVRASNSRHELNDSVHALALKVALGSRERKGNDV